MLISQSNWNLRCSNEEVLVIDYLLYAHNENSVQTGWMTRLVLVVTGFSGHSVFFSYSGSIDEIKGHGFKPSMTIGRPIELLAAVGLFLSSPEPKAHLVSF